jgi:hypothetical protein
MEEATARKRPSARKPEADAPSSPGACVGASSLVGHSIAPPTVYAGLGPVAARTLNLEPKAAGEREPRSATLHYALRQQDMQRLRCGCELPEDSRDKSASVVCVRDDA